MDISCYQSIKFLFRLTSLIFVFSLLSCSRSSSATAPPASISYSVGGTLIGLQGSVTLQNNSADILVLNSAGSFTFQNKLSNGASYNVEVQTQPAGQSCRLSNASGVINSADVTNIGVVCATSVALSGSYQIAPLVQVDSDINDPFAVPNVSNNIDSTPQSISNFSTVQGFATLAGTSISTVTDRTIYGDRFANSPDETDVYRVNLLANQTLRLQVVDYAGLDVFQGDLNLHLFDSGYNLVVSSTSKSEFENITVRDDGDYFIVVNAFEGSSKYILNLNGVSAANITQQNSVDFKVGEAIIKFKANTQVNNFKASHQQMQLSHAKTTRAALGKFEISDKTSVLNLSSKIPRPDFMAVLKQKNFASYQKIKTLREIKRLNLRDDVEYAEPNYIYKPLLVPDDTFYNLQWHYPAINLPQAWDITTGSRVGSDVIVAVVDTGVFLAHPELSGQLVNGYDFIADVQNAADGDGIDPNPDDPGDSAQLSSSSWHGTHVAGTVAALSNNTSGVAGVAWQSKIMPLRVLGTQGGTDYDIRQAIRYAAGLDNDSRTVPAQKADIINLSLGGGGYSQASQDTYMAVRSAGVIVVAAAGNENTSQLSYPASYNGVVSVSATDFANNRAPYSNFGTTVDIAAPGGNQGVDLNNDNYGDGVLSTLVDDSSGSRVGVLNFYQGTSMAAPHVAGVFALMRAVYPALSPDEVDAALASGVITTDLGAAGRDDVYGHGLIDALKAVQEAQRIENGGTPPLRPALIVATPNKLVLGNTSEAILMLSNLGDEPASITSVIDDANWLTVEASNVDATSQLGDYLVTINRSALSTTPASYLGTITFNLSTGGPLYVEVFMDVGLVEKAGNVGMIYMLLFDENYNFVDQVSSADDGNGNYNYRFDGVIAGNYRIIGGSDIDNDIFICQLAEACGGYPTINALTTVTVSDSDITGLNFIVDLLANFAASSSSANTHTGFSGFKRRVDPLMDNKQLSR